jgi:SAM-dependent methyltransferase
MSANPPPPRRLNWGCGNSTPPGWINADVKDLPGVDLVGDIRDGLPLADGSMAYVVSIHALPMISYPDLVPVLEELRRVLEPGGVLRLSLPDLERGIAAYQRGDRDYFLVPDSEVAAMGSKLIVQLLWYGYSVTLFTADFIEELLLKAGFSEVAHCGFRQSKAALDGITDLDNREAESLFVEATK